MSNFQEDEFYDGEEDDICESCGCGLYDSPKCPDCCGNIYSPGTEQCDWCPYDEECGRLFSEKF